jgi:hypothetical protein
MDIAWPRHDARPGLDHLKLPLVCLSTSWWDAAASGDSGGDELAAA